MLAAGLAIAGGAESDPNQGGGLPPPPLGLDAYMPVPPGNPPTVAAAALGQRLFFDAMLSADGSVSCASCHRPERAFADTVPRSSGVFGRHASRNTPSILNAGYGTSLFWDGRARTLEDQVLQPITNPDEMGANLSAVVRRLADRPTYRDMFRSSFDEDVTATNLARALATYVRTLRAGGSAADRYAAGDETALDADARAGLRLFQGKARCVECHFGPLFTDERFHNTGVGWGGEDTGHMGVTHAAADRGKFNTPSLRNVALTAPYMHDGSLATLEDVVDFYARGGNTNPNLDEQIRALRMTLHEKTQLVRYVRALSSSDLGTSDRPE